MLNAKFIEDITAKLSAVANSSPAKDLEKNMRASNQFVFAEKFFARESS